MVEIANQTNLYFQQWRDKDTANKESRVAKDWKDVSLEDMKTFLGVMMYVGLNPSSYKDLWSTNPLLERPGFRRIMARDRFLAILRFLHLQDNTGRVPNGQEGHDRLFKVRDCVAGFVTAWQAAFHQEVDLAVDEAMVAFKGKTNLLQYIKSKPKKWGIKAWVLAGAITGFVSEWNIYEGKDDAALAVGHGVVVKLSANVQPGQTITCDNFFSSVKLFSDLKERGIGACGTVCANRVGNPPALALFKKGTRKAVLVAKSPLFLRNDTSGVLAVGWMDKRPVTLLSTVSGAGVTDVRIRAKGLREGRVIHKPDAVHDYNTNMSGVDHSDQINSYYIVENRSMKWWKKVFFHVMNTAVTNAFILYKVSTPAKEQMADRKFRMAIVSHLLGCYEHPTTPRRMSLANNNNVATEQRLEGKHFLETGDRRLECVVCTVRGDNHSGVKYKSRTQTKTQCKTCVPKVTLCISCFEIYHTAASPKDYWYKNVFLPTQQ